MAVLFIIRYRSVSPGLFSMALFRLPLWLNKKISFWRLMGSGRNGTFDIVPDWKQWSIMVVIPESWIADRQETISLEKLQRRCLGDIISDLISLWNGKVQALLLEPKEGHGLWKGREVFGSLERKAGDWEGPIAVMTRATIRLSKAKAFWKHVDQVAQQMAGAPGFITSYGIGEVPFIKQATFSIWESKQAMQAFAYQMHEHREVIKKTYAEKWYSEEMFVRFRIIRTWELPAIEHQLGQAANHLSAQ